MTQEILPDNTPFSPPGRKTLDCEVAVQADHVNVHAPAISFSYALILGRSIIREEKTKTPQGV